MKVGGAVLGSPSVPNSPYGLSGCKATLEVEEGPPCHHFHIWITSLRVCHSEPLVDQTSLEGAVPRIQRANAEEFIHIFVNNATQLTEFLEHMVEVTSA